MSSASRRGFLRLTAILAVASTSSAVLAACGAATPTAAPPKPAEAPKPTEAPKPAAAAPAQAPAATKPAEPSLAATPPGALTKPAAAPAAPTPAAAAKPGAPGVELRWAQSTLGEARDRVQDEMAEGFKKVHPNIRLKIERRPYEQYYVKIQTEFTAGAAPDVTFLERDWAFPAAARGVLLDLMPYLTRENIKREEYFDEVFKSYTWKGKYWGTYLYGTGEAYWANKDLFEKAGVKLPPSNWTFDDLVATTKALTKGEGPGKQYGLNWGHKHINSGLATLTRNMGGKILNEKGDKAIWADDPKSIEAAQWMMDTVHKHKVAPTPQAMQGQPPLFVSRRVGIEQQGSARLAQMIDALKQDLAVLTTPTGPAGNFPYMASACWNVLSSTKLKDESWELAKSVGLGPGQEIVLKMGIPAKKALAHGPFLQQYPGLDLKPALDNYEKNGTWYVFTVDASEWWTAASQALELMWSGEKTVPEAMRAAQDAVNQVFARRPADWNE